MSSTFLTSYFSLHPLKISYSPSKLDCSQHLSCTFPPSSISWNYFLPLTWVLWSPVLLFNFYPLLDVPLLPKAFPHPHHTYSRVISLLWSPCMSLNHMCESFVNFSNSPPMCISSLIRKQNWKVPRPMCSTGEIGWVFFPCLPTSTCFKKELKWLQEIYQ